MTNAKRVFICVVLIIFCACTATADTLQDLRSNLELMLIRLQTYLVSVDYEDTLAFETYVRLLRVYIDVLRAIKESDEDERE